MGHNVTEVTVPEDLVIQVIPDNHGLENSLRL
jgi:hypothetical protein